MKNRTRRTLSMILVLAIVVSILPAFKLAVETAAATTAENKTAIYDFVADISPYRVKTEAHDANNNNGFDIGAVYTDYPAKEGYVFAGWYTDLVNLTPLATTATSGGAYAKFVPQELMQAVAQVSTNIDYASNAAALRFVAAVDGLDYSQVGFLLNREGSVRTYTYGATGVYDTLSAAVDGGSLTPSYFHSSAAHMFALTVTGIKDQTAGYTATPFWITMDGTKVDHIPTAPKTVQMGVSANMAAGKTETNPETAWYKNTDQVVYIHTAQELLSFARMSRSYNFAGKTVKLAADITFNPDTLNTQSWFVQDTSNNTWSVKDGVEIWPGIGSAATPFAGTIDGQGHTVQGLAMLGTGKLGFILESNGATVKNLRIEKSIFRNTEAGDVNQSCTGAVVALANNTTISNVYTDAYLAYGKAVGMVGHAKGTTNISNCWFSGTLNGAWGSIYAGGFVGFGNSSGTTINLTNCLFTGAGAATFNTGAYVGGLVGFGNYSNTIKITNCLSAGNLNAAAFKGAANGAVIGNTPGSGKGTYTNVYVTNECYKDANGNAVVFGNPTTKHTGEPVLVAKADISGTNAKELLTGLSFADGTWITVSEGVPELGAVSANCNTAWYDPQAAEYVLYTAADLRGLAMLSQTLDFAGKTVKLGADITLNSGNAADWSTTAPANAWAYIGSAELPFAGTVDGQGHTLSGVYFKNTAGSVSTGMFPVVNNATIKNLTITNSFVISTAGSGNLGLLAGLANGITVENVKVGNDVAVNGATNAGLVGYTGGATAIIFRNVWMDGTVTNGMWTARIGGLLGTAPSVANQTVTVDNCLFTGTLKLTHATSTAENYIGGFVGGLGADVKISVQNSLSAGTLTLANTANTKNYAGSLVGVASWRGAAYTSFTNCYATTDTYPVVTYRAANTYTGTPTLVDRSAVTGETAATTLSGFDFNVLWQTRQNDVPKLGNDQCDTSWYSESATEYVLYDAADLYGFSVLQETLTFEGKTIKLGADILLNEGDAKTWATNAPANMWNPIGKSDASLEFEGTFDGQGHTISGLYYDSALYGGGLFTVTGHKAVIRDLRLENSYIRSTHGAEWSATGSIVAFVNGTTLRNVYSDAIIDSNSGYTGGIGGRPQGYGVTLVNCEFAGTLTTTGSVAKYVGGLVGGHNGNIVGDSLYKDCVVSGTVTGSADCVGGVSGRNNGAAGETATTVENFRLTGSVSGTGTQVGGVFGMTQTVPATITNANISGNLTATAGIAGGMVGRVGNSTVTIDQSVFTGTINGGTKLGGFVGQTNTAGFTTTVKNSRFNGTVRATNTNESVVAGIVAHMNNGNVTIEDCLTEGTLVAPGPYAAGAVANIANISGIVLKVDGVISTTDVQCASSNAGGIIGRILGTNVDATVQNTLAKATFTTDSWCTSQIIAHAQGNGVKAYNNFFVQTPNSASVGVESSGGSLTEAPVKVDESLWNHLRTLFESGIKPDFDGFSNQKYTIKDRDDFYGFAVYNEVKGFAGKTAKLEANIVINEGEAARWATDAPKYNWRPISSFAGTFDGQGYTISGLYCGLANGNGLGVFDEVTGTVTNFRLENSYLANLTESNYGYNGGVVANLNGGTVSRIYSNAIVETVDSYAGGIVGCTSGASATITECQFDGKLAARCSLHNGCVNSTNMREHARYVGGIAGALVATTNNITDCVVLGSIYNEDKGTHRTGGIAGGAPESGKAITIDRCFSLPNFRTLGHTGDSYHFNMIMDCRGESGITTKLTNSATMFKDNYILNTKAYQADGLTVINGNTAVSGAYSSGVSTIRYTREDMAKKIYDDLMAGTSKLDFGSTWMYQPNEIPALRLGDTSRTVVPYHLTVGEDKILCLSITDLPVAEFKDANLKATLLEGQTNENGWQLYSLAYEYPENVAFKDIDYTEGAYITKYQSAKLADYTWYIQELQNYGFQVYASNVVNTDDAYYTALTNSGYTYSVTFFANTGELYVTASNEMNFSPYMDPEYYKTADDGDPKKTTYNDITVTMVELSDGGLCQIIRLKNGHYIVIDGGTGTTAAGTTINGTTYTEATKDRAELAAALGASLDAYSSGNKNNPQIIVDAWVFTHDHADHVGWLRGGVYGAMQVDVYVKGFYYNFTGEFRVDAEFTVGSTTVQGYGNQLYAYSDSKGEGGTNRYYKANLDNGSFWVEYSATNKMANNVNTPSWGQKGIPIYRLQAGQKYYFDGVTMEVPYTQDQVMPADYEMDVNGSSAWLLFTDDHGNTYLEAGDTEEHNQDDVIALYDDYYDGGSGPNYALFGADLVNAFHHGLNMQIKGENDYTRQNILFGIQNADGNPATANTATNAKDGRTKFIFYTRGSLNTLFGYVSNKTDWNSRMQRGNHYLTGYVYPGLGSSNLSAAKAYPNLPSPIAFASYSTKADDKGYSWQGTTVVSFSASGISWNKQQTSSIYP